MLTHDFQIIETVEITDSFTGASSIRLEIESGIYDQWKRVAIMDDLCSYAGTNLQRVYPENDSYSCPAPGYYQLQTYFTVPSFTQDSEFHYTPDIRFTGTVAIGSHARHHADQGLTALTIALFVMSCVFSSLIYLNYGRERRLLAEKHKQNIMNMIHDNNRMRRSMDDGSDRSSCWGSARRGWRITSSTAVLYDRDFIED